MHLRASHVVLAVVAALAATGCGSSSSNSRTAASPTGARSAATHSGGGGGTSVAQLRAAEHPALGHFPSARGRTLQQLASLAQRSAQFGAATGTFTPGRRRLAFGLSTSSGAFVYAPSAVYLARSAGSPAAGPYAAPADPVTVAPAYRSAQNAGPGGVQAIYEADVPLPAAGTYQVLVLTWAAGGLLGAVGEIAVAPTSPIPDVGGRPPAIATDTPASTHGNLKLLSTRIPPDDMHAVALNQVLGKRPVALLFSTPQLCTSRVCGPVTDIAVELEHRYRNRIAFIHQEVYVNNQPSLGLRPQMKAFHLETEPWLFAIDAKGVVAARLEGAFGVEDATRALEAALR